MPSSTAAFLSRRLRASADERAWRSRRGGFTLLEILLVLAILALLSAVLIGGATQLLSNKPTSADDVFWNAVQEARKTALKSERDVWLKWVDDRDLGKAFVVTDGSAVKSFPVPNAGDLEVTLMSQQKGNMIMVAGTILETQKIPAVTFYADGTCTPFRVQYYAKGAAHITTVDPWTCAPMLTSSDAQTPGGGPS